MPTNVRTDDKNLVTQYCASTAVQPADPVLLKPKGDPGVALHFNTSTTLNNPAGTVFDHGTQVAHHESYLGAGKHAPVVMAGRNTGLVDGDTGFLSFAKTVFIEGRNAVMHGVDASVNALWSLLPAALQTTVENAGQIAGGLSTQDFADAAQEDAQALLAALKSTDTLIALAQTAALMGVSAIPVVGQIAGGAATAQRIKSAIEATAGAAEEFQAMLDRWTQPMSPAQLAAERKTLASFLLRVGLGALLAALGKVAPKLSPKAKGRENSTTTHEAGTKPAPRPTTCACATGHPVIIATGEKSLAQTDFELPGPIPIEWTRKYRSGLMDGRIDEGDSPLAGGWFGPGWSAPLAVHLMLTAEALVYHDAAGRPVELPWIPVGAEHFDAYEQLTLRRPAEHDWRLVSRDGRMQRFVRPREDWFDLPLAGLADRNGRLLRLHYGALPQSPFAPWRPQAIEDSAGRMLALEWSARAQLLAVQCRVIGGGTDAWHTLSTYAYNEAGELIAQRDAQGAQRRYEWQGGVLVGYALPDGALYRAEYDRYSPEGRVTRSWAEVDGRGLRFEYDDRARCTRVSDALGRTTVYEYDERRDIVAIIGPDGQRQDTPFDHRGQPRSRTDALGRLTQYRFDARGNLTDVVDAAGQRTQLAYNELDLPVRITDALGQVWQRDYDGRGNLVAAIDPLQRRTGWEYDTLGQAHTITDAQGGRKRLEWDAQGNLAAWSDCSGRRSALRHDALGRLLAQTDALGQETRYTWDAAGRLLALAEPGPLEPSPSPDHQACVHRYTWSAEGRLLAYTDPLGAITRWRYNAHGEPVQRTDSRGHTLHYVYDAAGRLEALINENGEATRFRYDLADRLTDEIGVDGRHQRYVYNAAGELTHLIEAGGSEQGPGRVTRYERDALGRLTALRAVGDERCSARYAYDPLGRLVQADNPAAALAFAYDPAGQLLSETQTLAGGVPRVLAHDHDALGNRIRTTLPDGRMLHRLFYGSGHLHRIELQDGPQRQVITDIERDALHREVRRSQGGLESCYEHDPQGRLLRHRAVGVAQGEAAVIERRYRYDAAGRLADLDDSLRGQRAYRYDPVGHILSARNAPRSSAHSHGSIEEFFAFDPAGNLAPSGAPVAGNRLAVFQDLRYDYDLHGNVIRRDKGAHEQASYEWDAGHRLVRAVVTRRGVVQQTGYEYDALGRRTRKTDAFGASEYLWDGDLMIESRRGHRSELFIFEPDSFVPLATLQDGQWYWYQCDQIGTPQELTDAQGRIGWAAHYQVWGEAAVLKTGTSDPAGFQHLRDPGLPLAAPVQPFRFQGQQFDPESGLHYNRFRYYDPAVGRFVGQDPIGLAGGANLFAYTVNPVGWVDPLGLTGECCNCGKGKAIVRHYDTGSRTGHYTIEVIDGNRKLHTHQVINSDKTTTVHNESQWAMMGRDPVLHSVEIPLNNTDGAIEYQKSQIGKKLGAYDERTNSCVDHVANVLRAGGEAVESGPLKQAKYLKSKGFNLKVR